ncbi:hypothetical protein BU26DRAFT_525708 [Trematosphaeria pertusa]|uniref:Uncharacterized protein n=1 Tax=Trematosphaeria pertusa TaxID=390896 RepID=A0A6A6HS26_9PLEO|nr:uncharacterized protein BU26DRAFT_525708 [Trematosphaeria pertusa]KAF2240801.1 hypothetical protein BU26DRAFT_525708 [Trematosphaeria pertusa]
MEEELRRVGIVAPSDEEVPSSEGTVEWVWDPHRRSYCYCSLGNYVYKYQTGLWLRLDGSPTSSSEEAARKRAVEEAARRGPPAPPTTAGCGYAEGSTSGMRWLTTGNGEDGQPD